MKAGKAVLLSLCLCVWAFGQHASPNELSAKQLLEQTIAAMSKGSTPSSIRNFSLTGSMQMAGASSASAVEILARGQDDLRMKITTPDGGTHSVVFFRGRGRIRDFAGRETVAVSGSRAGTEIAFLPLPGILADLLNTAREVVDLGPDTVDGQSVRHILIQRQVPKERDPFGLLSAHSRTEMFIDTRSFLP